jgi:UDP-N-acetylglucosamine transferase subunit ALG13
MHVAHAGKGSNHTALELGKPILEKPRRGDQKETRNDNQDATAKKLGAFGRVNVALDETELLEKLDQLNEISAAQQIGPHASSDLLHAVRSFIFHGTRGVRAPRGEAGGGLAAAEVELARQVSSGPVLANG